jgi:RES domain-containing protein
MDWNLSLRSSGRYHRGSDLFPEEQTFPALYTSLAPETALWEMVRRSAMRNLAYLRNNVLSELRLDLAHVLNLSEPAAVGLVRADLTGPDFRRCQELAATASIRGYEGILVPSAALPGSNLVVLPRNLSETASLRLVRSIELPLDAMGPGGTT